jgi:hypothetical protein
MEAIQGYLTSQDAKLIAAILLFQNESNFAGNLCEIGVHHGRLFLMLALARRASERALAIDLFEDDAINANTSQAGRGRALSANACRLGIKFSTEEIFKTSSLDIAATDILARTTGPIRFFSIDGSHLYQPVENDLRLAEATMTAEGVIAIDDFFNKDWADATFATYDFLRRTDAWVPFAITNSKLFLATPAMAEKYKSVLYQHDELGHVYRVEILGRGVIALRESLSRRGYDMLRSLRRRLTSRLAHGY